MNIETANALLPIQLGIQPVAATQDQGIGTYRDHDRLRGGMRFVGLGKKGADTRYGPSGKILCDRWTRGSLVDIYV